jgi:hypothetical protein
MVEGLGGVLRGVVVFDFVWKKATRRFLRKGNGTLRWNDATGIASKNSKKIYFPWRMFAVRSGPE